MLLQHSVWQVQELGCKDSVSPIFLHGHPAMLQQQHAVLLYGHRHLAPKTGRQVHAGLRIHARLFLGGVKSQATQVDQAMWAACLRKEGVRDFLRCCLLLSQASGPIRPQSRPQHIDDRHVIEEGQRQATHLRRLRRFGLNHSDGAAVCKQTSRRRSGRGGAITVTLKVGIGRRAKLRATLQPRAFLSVTPKT